MRDLDPREREGVREDLGSPDGEVRRLAVERIDVLAPAERLDALVERLGDADWRVRRAAVSRLAAQSEAEAAVTRLLAALADGGNAGRRNAAIEALVALGAAAVPALLEACDDADAGKFAVDALAGIGDPRAVPRLVEALEDADPNLRAAAAEALGAIGGARAVEALQVAATAKGQQSLVRLAALRALDALEVAVDADVLSDAIGEPTLAPAALALLGRCEGDPGAVGALLEALGSPLGVEREAAIRGVLRLLARSDAPEAERLAARVREEARGSPALVDSAVERLADGELGTQLSLVQFLGLTRDPRAVLPILDSARDEALEQVALAVLEEMDCADVLESEWPRLGPEARRHACAVLGRSQAAVAAPRLIESLEDVEAEVRVAAARALGELGGARGLAALVRRLERIGDAEDPGSEAEREAVADALCRLAGPPAPGSESPHAAAAVDLLRSVWSGASDPVRLSVARVLGRIARPEDADLVSLLLADPVAPVRRAAVEAIARIEPQRCPEPLHLAVGDESPEVRRAAARALGESGAASVLEDLHCLCDDADEGVRAAAVYAMGRRFAADPAPELRAVALAALNQACEDTAPVALALVLAVEEIGGEASSYLEPLLQRPEPEVVREAARCFGLRAEPEELDRLLHLVSHPEWSVRAEVIEVLGQRRLRRAVPAILRRLETEQDDFVRRAILQSLRRLED